MNNMYKWQVFSDILRDFNVILILWYI